MPGIGGLEALREITSSLAIPVIMVSALTHEGAETTLRALEAGAVDFIPKPDAAYVNINNVARDLVAKVRVFSRRKRRGRQSAQRPKAALPSLPETDVARRDAFECVVIGTSTGGPVALSKIVPALPANFPVPVIVVQHMPAGFTRPLAHRLNTASRVRVTEARAGTIVAKGNVYVAPAGQHLTLLRTVDTVEIVLSSDEGRSLHVPSVDVTAASVAQTYGPGTLAAILTGMGHDGVVGLRCVKERGGYVVGQDAATSVVYGMPRAAADAGLVDRIVALDNVATTLCELTNTSFARS